jgi:hypothetical protein
MSVTMNPQLTTVASGSFNVETTGYIQGTALNDPAVRYQLAGGVLAVTETLPMWGGVAITEDVPLSSTSNTGGSLGGNIARATAETNVTGWSVFDQDHAMLTTPQSPVPLAARGMGVHFYRLGSNARIAVACSPNLVDLDGQIITTAVAWDYVDQELEPFFSATVSSGTYAGAVTISSGIYTTGTGAVSLTTNAAHGLLPGDSFSLNTMTGTGSFAALDGMFVAGAGTTGSTLTTTIATGLTMTITGGNLGTVGVNLVLSAPGPILPGDTFVSTLTGTGSFAALNGEQTAGPGTNGTAVHYTHASGLTAAITGGTLGNGTAIPVRILDVQVGNSMTVVYDPVSGFATWNRSGSCAIILI